MAKRRKNIITNNREIYEKFSALNYSPEVVLNNVKKVQVDKILRSINKESSVLQIEQAGKYFLIKKVGQINFNIYLK